MSFERALTGRELEEHDSKREDVASVVDRLALSLFRRHIGRRAYDKPFFGQILWRRNSCGVGPIRTLRQLRQPEVEHLDSAVGRDDHIARLQVAVSDSDFVRRCERVSYLYRYLEQPLDWHPAVTNQFDEAVPFHELHGEQEHVSIFLNAVDDCDVWVGERGKDPRLSPKTFAPCWVQRELIGDHFQCDDSVQAGIAGAIHLAHAPGPQLAQDLIPTELSSRFYTHNASTIDEMAASIAQSE